MSCHAYQPLISEYADGRLDREHQRRVQAHLDDCADCARFAQDLQAMGGLLRGLPQPQTSADFEARLAGRLRQPGHHPVSTPASWRRLAETFAPRPALWRPALGLGVAAAAVVGAVFFTHPAPPPVSAVPEGALVRHCVQQHRNYVAAQPLADISAQNLAIQLDDTGMTARTTPAGEDDL